MKVNCSLKLIRPNFKSSVSLKRLASACLGGFSGLVNQRFAPGKQKKVTNQETQFRGKQRSVSKFMWFYVFNWNKAKRIFCCKVLEETSLNTWTSSRLKMKTQRNHHVELMFQDVESCHMVLFLLIKLISYCWWKNSCTVARYFIPLQGFYSPSG